MTTKALARAMLARRLHLGWSQADLVRASHVSDVTIRRMERAVVHNFHTKTTTAVEHALGWPVGTIHRVLRGDTPPDPDAGIPSPTIDTMRARLDELAARVETIEQRIGPPP